ARDQAEGGTDPTVSCQLSYRRRDQDLDPVDRRQEHVLDVRPAEHPGRPPEARAEAQADPDRGRQARRRGAALAHQAEAGAADRRAPYPEPEPEDAVAVDPEPPPAASHAPPGLRPP